MQLGCSASIKEWIARNNQKQINLKNPYFYRILLSPLFTKIHRETSKTSTHNAEVGGSSPPIATKFDPNFRVVSQSTGAKQILIQPSSKENTHVIRTHRHC